MIKVNIRSLILIGLLLTACQRTSQWQCQHIREKNCHCSRLLYQSQDPVLGIDLEFLQTKSGLCTYLQVHQPMPQEAKIHIKTQDDQLTYIGTFHQGSQRVQLSEELQELLLTHLKKEKVVTIQLNQHRETIQGENFSKLLKNFESHRNPSFLKLKLL